MGNCFRLKDLIWSSRATAFKLKLITPMKRKDDDKECMQGILQNSIFVSFLMQDLLETVKKIKKMADGDEAVNPLSSILNPLNFFLTEPLGLKRSAVFHSFFMNH